MKNPDLYSYSDYREFLADYASLKRKSRSWSLTVWARKLKTCNKTMLSMIINGKRHPSSELMESFCQYFNFNEDESDFFKNLVYVQKAGNNSSAGKLLARHLNFKKNSKNRTILDKQTFDAISEWQLYAIREMVRLEGFKNDPEWISSKLHFQLSPQKIQKAIENLLALNLLATKNGELHPTAEQIATTDDISSLAIKNLHTDNIINSLKAVTSFDVDERYLSGVTLTIKKENIEKAKQLFRRFEDEFIELMEVNGGDSTYQMNIQFYPLTK